MLKDIEISKPTIYFEVKLVKVIKKCQKFKKSLLQLNFVKNYKKIH